MNTMTFFLGLAVLFLICWMIDKINALHAKSDPLRETGRDNPNDIRIGDMVTISVLTDHSRDPQDPNSWKNDYYKVMGWFDNRNLTLRKLTWDHENNRIVMTSTEIRECAKYLGRPHNRDESCNCVYCSCELL